MKPSNCLLLFCFISFPRLSPAQVSSDYNYTIGLRGYSYLQLPKVLDQVNSDDYVGTALNQVLIKFNDNQFAYRISGNYLKKERQFFNTCNTCELADGEVKDYLLKIGFEKNFNYSFVQPYVGFDLGYRYNKFNGTLPEHIVITTKEGFVVSPVVGIKFNPIKEISIFVEGNLDFFYSYERQERVTNDEFNQRTLFKYHKTEYLINPFALGLQVHLGKKN
jgi:hypothetical protein